MKFRNKIENCNRIVNDFYTEDKKHSMFEVTQALMPVFDTEAILRDYIAEFDEPYALSKHDKSYILDKLNGQDVLVAASYLKDMIIENGGKMVSDMLTKDSLPSDAKAYVNYVYEIQRALNQMFNESYDLFTKVYEVNPEEMDNLTTMGYYTALCAYAFTCDEKQDDYNNLVDSLKKLQVR